MTRELIQDNWRDKLAEGAIGCVREPATLLQSCTGCLKSLEILQSFRLEKVNFSVNYVILSVICLVKCFRKLLRKFTALLT